MSHQRGCSWALRCFFAGFLIGWTVERILTGHALTAFLSIYDPGPTLGGILGGVVAGCVGYTIGACGDEDVEPVNDKSPRAAKDDDLV